VAGDSPSTPSDEPGSEAWLLVALCLGTGIVSVHATVVVPVLVDAVAASETGVANSINAIVRCIGSAVGSALLASHLDRTTGPASWSAYVMPLAVGAVGYLGLVVAWICFPAHPPPRLGTRVAAIRGAVPAGTGGWPRSPRPGPPTD
jgi:predicted MFS family arabinose efflux permease